jgi:hypothetical protein
MIKKIILIIFIFLFIVPAMCFNIPGKFFLPSQVGQNEEPGESKPQGGGGGGRMNVQVNTIDEGAWVPVSIRKDVIKNDHNYYIKSPLQVRVEIKILGKKVNDLQAVEHVDKNLNIDSFSNCILLNDVRDIARMDLNALDAFSKTAKSDKIVEESIKNNESKFNEFKNDWMINNYSLDDNIIIEFNIKNYNYKKYVSDVWNNKSRLIYWYNISPEKTGIYETKTIVRTSGQYADVDETLVIPVIDPIPKFSIDADVDKSELKCYDLPDTDWLDVAYNIRYLGGASDPYLCDISLEPGEYILKENQSTLSNLLINKSFRLYGHESIELNLSWNSSNKYYIPSIYITDKNNNADYPINCTFKEHEIVVKGFWEINKEIIYWILLVSTLIFGSIFNKDINKKVKDCYYRAKQKCKPCKISYRKG